MKNKITRDFVLVHKDGTRVVLPLGRATQIMMDKKMLSLDEMPDGTYRLIWSQGLTENMSDIERIDIIRKEESR